jgi:hypothetical protein
MDHATIQAIATEVARQLPSYSWTNLAIQVGLIGLTAAVAAYWGAYLKKSAEHLVTKVHFDEKLRQLGESTHLVEKIKAEVATSNTELVETIKEEVKLSRLQTRTNIEETVRSVFAQRDWAAREWTNLRRVKIEELVEKVNECRTYLRHHSDAVDNGEPLPADDPLTQLETIVRLYLPELEQQTDAFSHMHKKLVLEGETLRYLEKHGDDVKDRKSKYASLAARTNGPLGKSLSAALIDSARGLLEDMMGVKPRQEGAGGRSEVEISETNRPP